MTYVVNVNGTDNGLQGHAKAAFDQDCIDKARAFVDSLEGVVGATISTNTQGSIVLKGAA